MSDPSDHPTLTLAALYADQGHYEKAIETYQHLLRKFPDREDIKDNLSDLKVKMQKMKTTKEPELAMLFQKWFDLLTKYKQIRTSQ